jgi:hypothetical protein
MKNNKWKIATIILGIFCLFLLIFNLIQEKQIYKIESTKGFIFEISKSNFDKATEDMNLLQVKKLYDIEHLTSVKVMRISQK